MARRGHARGAGRWSAPCRRTGSGPALPLLVDRLSPFLVPGLEPGRARAGLDAQQVRPWLGYRGTSLRSRGVLAADGGDPGSDEPLLRLLHIPARLRDTSVADARHAL